MTLRSFLRTRQNNVLPACPSSSPLPAPSLPDVKHGDDYQEKNDDPSNTSRNSIATADAAMVGKSGDLDTAASVASPRTSTTIPARTTTPSHPVQIPVRPKSRDHPHQPKHHRHHHGDKCRRAGGPRPRDVHSPDAVPASVAALLALTTIPPPRRSRPLRKKQLSGDARLTVGSIIEQSQESEKELSLTLGRGPLDILLSPPEDGEDDGGSMCDSNLGSVFSTRTVSLDSVPSLGDSFATEILSSLETPSPSSSRSRRLQPTRPTPEPVSSPPGELEDHPLSSREIDLDELDFRVFDDAPPPEMMKPNVPLRPLKSAFKSNLTASLRALRQAARSFSALNFSIPPEDFLTRSILTLDPQVPYTDERRPPPLEEEPTDALRRYLNPTTRVPALAATPATPPRSYTASIQMQTYKVYRARASSTTASLSRLPRAPPLEHRRSVPAAVAPPPPPSPPPPSLPGPRQREMRENSDFIRIAVMEMAMRKRGKLDDQRPGRARWALPPRKVSSRPYVIRADGVPARWTAITY